jgi:aminoglycoside phosphotransferase (APT) family kinase protein
VPGRSGNHGHRAIAQETKKPALTRRAVDHHEPRSPTPVFTHGDLQITHVFADGDEITGVIDWSEAGQGDALFNLATPTSTST